MSVRMARPGNPTPMSLTEYKCQCFVVGYIQGVRDYVKAFTTKVGRDDVVSTLMKYTTVKDAKLYDVMEMPYVDPNGLLGVKSLEAQYKWYVEMGLYKGNKNLTRTL